MPLRGGIAGPATPTVPFGARAMETEDLLGQARAYLRGPLSRSCRRVAEVLVARATTLVQELTLEELRVDVALLAAQLHLLKGAVAEATRLATEAVQEVHAQGRRSHEALARRVLGQCALAADHPSEAEALLRAALALQMDAGLALEVARTRLVLADALVTGAQGTIPDEARTLLADALAQFSASGAQRDMLLGQQVDADWHTPI